MPRTSSAAISTRRRRRRTTHGRDTRLVVTQITQLVAANESLKLENARLQSLNEQLRSELTEIGSALGSLTGGGRGRGRRGAAALALPDAKPRRQRRPITDPEVLASRNAALAKARAARRRSWRRRDLLHQASRPITQPRAAPLRRSSICSEAGHHVPPAPMAFDRTHLRTNAIRGELPDDIQ
jgi:hypothetical protein